MVTGSDQRTYRLSIVTTLLLIPPVAIGISELALLRDGVYISTILLRFD
jgi:hypothetical protein